ncbi:MAG: hypothetical protein ACREOS_11010 [Candidatus Dormibacteraceae bacterium]
MSDAGGKVNPAGAYHDLRRALATRREVGSVGEGSIKVALRGGSAAFLKRAARRRLLTILESGSTGLEETPTRAWLERRQARRSAFLITPDRATGVTLALRWGLDPGRFRLASQIEQAERTAAGAAGAGAPRPWHVP